MPVAIEDITEDVNPRNVKLFYRVRLVHINKHGLLLSLSKDSRTGQIKDDYNPLGGKVDGHDRTLIECGHRELDEETLGTVAAIFPVPLLVLRKTYSLSERALAIVGPHPAPKPAEVVAFHRICLKGQIGDPAGEVVEIFRRSYKEIIRDFDQDKKPYRPSPTTVYLANFLKREGLF